ncbi:MAG: penicillin-binding protein 2 [Candidatus Vogelbacteria bacterium]|nr:penicillin-binding protein 2 [Candidatus Vogelbacteria bacterium]
MAYNSRNRLKGLSIIIVLVSLACLIQLFLLQVVRGESFKDEADRQYIYSAKDDFSRGSIFFSDKDGKTTAAATLRPSFTLAINPQKIKDPEKVFGELSLIIDLDKTKFIDQATKKNDTYEVIANDIDKTKADTVSKAKITGVSIYKQKKRFYPGGQVASHVIGFVGWGLTGGKQVFGGRYGLEKFYEDILARDSNRLYVNFFAQVFAGLSSLTQKENSIEADVVLTIEPSVQTELENELRKVEEKWEPESTGGIVMDPNTGEIMAMAATPSFDPNSFNKVDNILNFNNPLVENVYEMGSIMKPLTMAAALDANTITPDTTYVDNGNVKVGIATISNYDGRGRGKVNMQEVLNQSLNTGMVFVMQTMGVQKFTEYMKNYRLAEKSGIDLPNEVNNLVANLDSPREVEHATAAFGQGIAVTPIATIRALAALGNGGYLVKPHVTKEVRYSEGIVDVTKFEKGKRILKAETSKKITEMLVTVVDKALVNGKAKMENYTIAAKTGTAQMSNPSGGYYDDRYMHTFFGYFPAYNPRFIIVLYSVNPKGAQYASVTMTEPFMNMAKFLLNYYQIPNDR